MVTEPVKPKVPELDEISSSDKKPAVSGNPFAATQEDIDRIDQFADDVESEVNGVMAANNEPAEDEDESDLGSIEFENPSDDMEDDSYEDDMEDDLSDDFNDFDDDDDGSYF